MNADRIFVGILRCSNSLVAFVASVLTHAKNVTADRRKTCRFWHAKMLRARVQLLQRLPFRPEIELKPQMNADERRSDSELPSV
jgi:hypothetical protein